MIPWNQLARGVGHPRRSVVLSTPDLGRWVATTDAWTIAFERTEDAVAPDTKPLNGPKAEGMLRSILGLTTWQTVSRAALLGALTAHAELVCDFTEEDRPEPLFFLDGVVQLCGVHLSIPTLFPVLVTLRGVADLEIAADPNPIFREHLTTTVDAPTAPALLALRHGPDRIAGVMRSRHGAADITALAGLGGA